MNDRQAEHRIVRVSKHFFKISNSDSNDYNPTSTHNPGNSYISFNNPGITNITSSSDSTITRLNPISFTIDLYYNNVSESLRNNRFHVMTSNYANGLGVLSQGGLREGTNGFVPSVKLNDGIYKTGEDMGAELLRALNAAAISWHGGSQIVWTGTGYNAATKSMKFRINTAAPGPPSTTETKAAVEVTVFADLDENGFLYDASRILGLNNTRALNLPYDASQAAGGVISPSFVDVQTIQVLQVRSNIAKRFFQKQGNSANPANRPLSLTNILFEIPTEPASLGGTLTWFALDNRYEQEVLSNFDEMSIQLTDKNGNVVNFTNSAEWNFNFSISRDVITPSNEDRIRSMMDYNQFKQF
jgi:hypothetical protein